MANGKCLLYCETRIPRSQNCLLAASNLPLWPFRLEGRTGTGRMGGFDVVRQEKLRHAELSDPLFFSITPPNPFSSFQNNLFLLSFDIKKKKRTIIRAPPFFLV